MVDNSVVSTPADNTKKSLLDTLIEAYAPDGKSKEWAELLKAAPAITSVFDITVMTKAAFKGRLDTAINGDESLKTHGASIDTGALYKDAKCYAAQISHLYREQRTSDGTAQDQWHPLGIRAVEKQGPTYTHLFKENWDDACKNDSIAAIDSPVAYLRALYRFALQLESSASSSAKEKANRITLGKRRPDLADLSIDQQSTFTAQPMLGIVNAILDQNIQDALKTTDDKDKSTYDVLAQRYYPFALPYEFFHHQCLLGLGANKPMLGELNYLVSEYLPLTQNYGLLFGKVQNSSSDQAQRLMSGLSPNQQALLTELPWTQKLLADAALARLPLEEQRTQKDNYWEKIYGTASVSDLKKIQSFLERTELKAEQLEALLAQGKHAPHTSAHYLLSAPYSQPYGARYVNGPLATTEKSMSLGIEKSPAEITNATEDQLERLHRMIRLQRWLDMPFTDLDSLLCSAFESKRPRNAQMQLDCHAIQALGVYGYLNRKYSITAEEFAALLHQLTPCANGDNTALLDKVFNQSRVFDTPLKLDGRAFQADNSDPASHTILQHLSISLGLPLTDESLLLVVKNTQKHLGSLKCDLRTLSSIYRQARIARMFGVSISESSTLANLLGGESISRCLATGDTGRRILRIRGQKRDQYFEFVAHFQLPERDGPGEATLLAGSSLQTNTSWFAEAASDKRLDLRFTKEPDEMDEPWIYIDQIPTIGSTCVISMEGQNIKWNGAGFDKLTLRQTSSLTLQSFQSEKFLTSMGSWSGDIDEIALSHEAPQGVSAFNFLDLLMQLDWITGWIKESAYDIPMLQRVLELQSSTDYPLGDLQQYLTKLRADTPERAVTAQEWAALALPRQVDWREKLARTLLDDKGLVKNFAPTIKDDVPRKLTAALNQVVDDATLKLDEDPENNRKLKDECKQKLKKLLLLAHDRQQHLIEAFLQETFLLPMNCAKDVVIWANTSVHQILTAALDSKDSHQLARTLHPLLRHTEAAVRLQLSNKALRALLSTARWLDTPDGQLRLSFKTLYLFDRFNHFMSTYQQPEENLLSYLEFANFYDREADVVNERLAQLLNWTTVEVTVLTSQWQFKKAQTIKDIDWVMRCHSACKATGLGTTALLGAAALDNNSSPAQWKTVGEAIMAASH
ncbi:Tc toxin subunit A [Pseudomonas sp. NPDC099000]|uniref:Tc toxin subunit A n=1 Tax=Pseudomonas sp. NPDC099000 TaxID=3364488 RepID=UPI00383B4D58